MKKIKIKTEYITIGQFIKYIGLVSQGSDIKSFIIENKIYVDGEIENRRGRKVYRQSIIKINDLVYMIV